uniref:Calmodulin-like 4b n=1 Tax=Pundamilia nyererei TaxID=303518 RepID=A0A3B4H5R4_9CICH
MLFLLSFQAKFLTQDQINEFKECFSLYDRQRKGKIEAKELITVMRCLGSSPTPSEVQRHLLSHNMGELDFSTFLSIMHRQLQQEAPEQEILEAMRMADKEQKGFILASELRAKLTGLGEKLTDKEGECLLKPLTFNPLEAGVADLQQLKTNNPITPHTCFMSFFYSEVPLQVFSCALATKT